MGVLEILNEEIALFFSINQKFLIPSHFLYLNLLNPNPRDKLTLQGEICDYQDILNTPTDTLSTHQAFIYIEKSKIDHIIVLNHVL